MKTKDTTWSGLLKIPEEVVIKELRKELSSAKVEIGQLKSYIDELESKSPTRVALDRYYETRVHLWEKALWNNDNRVKSLQSQKEKVAQKLHDLSEKCSWVQQGGSAFCLPKNKLNLLMDVLLYGIAYAEKHDLYVEGMDDLYRTIKKQLK